jgi:heme exporter protein B
MNRLIRALFFAVMRDLKLAARHKTDLLTTLFFFVIVVTLLPLGIGPDPVLLKKIAPGAIWIGALLSTLLGLQRLFASDYQDGTLEQMALSPEPFIALVAGKILAHWLVCGLPVVLISPVLGLQLGLDGESLTTLMLSLLLGTPILSLIGSTGAALTLGLRGGGALLSLLVLPLYIPTLIFGAGAVESQISGMDVAAYFSLLGALGILGAFFVPIATAMALRIALE